MCYHSGKRHTLEREERMRDKVFRKTPRRILGGVTQGLGKEGDISLISRKQDLKLGWSDGYEGCSVGKADL